jgi:hypothetical protein
MDEEQKENIKNLVKEYVNCIDSMKELKDRKTELEEELKYTLEKTGIDAINTNEFKISFVKTERTMPVKSKDIIEIIHSELLEHPNTSNIAEDLMEQLRSTLESKKEKKQVSSLKVNKK